MSSDVAHPQATLAWSESGSTESADYMSSFRYSESEFRRIEQLLGKHAGIHLAASKKQMAFNRLVGLVRHHPRGSFGDFLDDVERGQRDLVEAFVNALTTNVTSFNRERHHLNLLIERLRVRGLAGARIWSAGCSSGQEVWSILLALDQAFGTATLTRAGAGLLGSDIDTRMLGLARAAIYRRSQIDELEPFARNTYFEPAIDPDCAEPSYRLRRPWRELATFRTINLNAQTETADDSGRGFDAIFCRNVMIYFGADAQRRALERFHRCLVPGGLLFVGHSEALGAGADLFVPLGQTCFVRREHYE